MVSVSLASHTLRREGCGLRDLVSVTVAISRLELQLSIVDEIVMESGCHKTRKRNGENNVYGREGKFTVANQRVGRLSM